MKRYSVNLILWRHDPVGELKDQYPIYLKIVVEGKKSYISTGVVVKAIQWDSSNQCVVAHPTARLLNMDLTNRKSQALQRIINLELGGKDFSALSLKQQLIGTNPSNIFDFIDRYYAEVRDKRSTGTLIQYRKHRNTLKAFHGSDDLTFEQITPDYLLKFETHLRKEMKNNYINSIFRMYKAFFNAAIKRGVTTNYPLQGANPEDWGKPTAFAAAGVQYSVYLLTGETSESSPTPVEKHVDKSTIILAIPSNGAANADVAVKGILAL
ncbi:MAG: phage integrase SAM-like domain-containing protein [Bacteroidetes bacterium]|nr:phage integrase SAM-like domain-containing protein [Bacteroidota bacterium]